MRPEIALNKKNQRDPEGQQAASSAAGTLPVVRSGKGRISALEGVSGTLRDRRALLPGERWFAVQCQSHREPGAAMQLRNQGFQVFLPLRSMTWRHARRIETRQVPFFPGYLFIVLDLDRDAWRSVNGTFGVQRLVMAGGGIRPMPVPPGLIETLRCEADDRGCLANEDLLRVGQAVRILAGPFGDRMGELIELDGAGRVRVLIELLGARIPVAMSRDDVMATR